MKFLQDIKDKTDAIPLYTNFAAGWTMTAWDAYIYGGATADPDWKNITMPQTKDPFADRVTAPALMLCIACSIMRSART